MEAEVGSWGARVRGKRYWHADLFLFATVSGEAAVKMKFNPFVISDRRKNCKGRFSSPSHIRRKMVFSPRSE